MKLIKTVLVGLVIGGAFGSKIGAYLANIADLSTSWSSIELGFTVGALGGSIVSLTVVFARSGIFQNQRSDQSIGNIATEGI